jgi:cobalt-zinc-cadmium resistance protein CzcA
LSNVVEAVDEQPSRGPVHRQERGGYRRSVGLTEKDLENIVLKSKSGTPVFLRQVADVATGGEVRRGLATMNGKGETVVGMVLKLIGTNTSTVIKDVKERMDKINKVLPPGIKVVPYYDQATLVAKCVRTVTNALIEAGLLIVLIQLLMGRDSASIVVLAAIPSRLGFSSCDEISRHLRQPHVARGLAIALGLLVDGAVMVENVDRTLREKTRGTLPHLIFRACA